jgi:5-methylcytosine-specific restriction endonuclease McrA
MYEILKTYKIEEIFSIYNSRYNDRACKKPYFKEENGYRINLRRVQVFKEKGICCANCKAKASLFILEKEAENRVILHLIGMQNSEIFELTIDHIIPCSLGGADNISNYQILCSKCNTSKGSNSDIKIYIDSVKNEKDFLAFEQKIKNKIQGMGVKKLLYTSMGEITLLMNQRFTNSGSSRLDQNLNILAFFYNISNGNLTINNIHANIGITPKYMITVQRHFVKKNKLFVN